MATRWIPLEMRGIIRAYINSDQDADKARALELCAEYGIDYALARQKILDQMIEYERERLARPARGEGEG